MESGRKGVKMLFFTSGFAKGILLKCERIPFGVQKVSFCKVKGKLLEAKTGIFRTILFAFRPIRKIPENSQTAVSVEYQRLTKRPQNSRISAEGKVF
jgi:hypothetical protein